MSNIYIDGVSIEMSIVLPIVPQNIVQLFSTAAQIWRVTIIPTFIFYIILFASIHLSDYFRFFYPIQAGQPGYMLAQYTKLILFIIGIFFYTSFYISIIYRTNNIIKSHDLDFGQTATYGFKKFFPVLGVSLLFGLCTLLGVLLLIIPGIIFFIYFFFSQYFVVFGKGIIESMQESFRLIRNHWWRTAFTLVAIYIPLILLSLIAIYLITSLIISTMGIPPGQTAEEFIKNFPKVYSILAYIIMIIILIPISHFVTSYFLAYFYDLHTRKQEFVVEV